MANIRVSKVFCLHLELHFEPGHMLCFTASSDEKFGEISRLTFEQTITQD